MTVHECSSEDQVVQAVLSGAWPRSCDPALAQHAAQCDVCSEVVAVATALRVDHHDARLNVHVPAAGQVWWRAAVRARLERTHAATQPMTWLHGLTGAVTVGLALALVGIAWPSIAIGAEWTKSLWLGLMPQADVAAGVLGALRQSFIVALVAGACLVVAPLALYFALSDD
jgi:hypothetical protein